MLFVVKYTGPFGFIKPWTAVRDSETFSQQFLTPSIVEGIEKKLFPELLQNRGIQKIVRHRLSYQGLDFQIEVTWSKGLSKKTNPYLKNRSIITRGVMLNPFLYLAFNSESDAKQALIQTICLARNEDLLYPEKIIEIPELDFDKITGFELFLSNKLKGFKVGYNRFDKSEMYGELKIFGNPIRVENEEFI